MGELWGEALGCTGLGNGVERLWGRAKGLIRLGERVRTGGYRDSRIALGRCLWVWEHGLWRWRELWVMT